MYYAFSNKVVFSSSSSSFSSSSSSSSSAHIIRSRRGRRFHFDKNSIKRSLFCSGCSSSSTTTTTTTTTDDDNDDDNVVQKSKKHILLVSDLDGTMIGSDEATLDFRRFWEQEINNGGTKAISREEQSTTTKKKIITETQSRRSNLVYSTGRSLHSFEKLLQEKRDILLEPDLLICSVGTKIYKKRVDDEEEYNDNNTMEKKWIEEEEWTKKLEIGWSASVVRDACKLAIEICGEERAHFRPEGEQNEHKITCGMKDEVVEKFTKTLSEQLDRANVTAKIITSGTGGWKYVDCVSNQAGKLESLEFVRNKLGFALEQTVACGDSGNDELMLSGRNLAIVVGNAQEDLVKWATKACEEDGKRVVVTKAFEARGIVEGIRTHFF
jgi:sucrose-6F-phosphate phosphohydrolase